MTWMQEVLVGGRKRFFGCFSFRRYEVTLQVLNLVINASASGRNWPVFASVHWRVSAAFDVGRDDGLGSQRNPLGVTLFGDRSASPPDSSLIWGSSGPSGLVQARPQGAAIDALRRAWDLWESSPR